MGKSFIDKCIDTEASLDEVDDYIDYWHESDIKEDLHEYLGMSWEEYAKFAMDGSDEVLYDILCNHRKEK